MIEFDSPFKLIANNENDTSITRKGYFSDMIQHTGAESADKIFQIAKDSYFLK